MLERLQSSDFTPLVEQRFQVSVPGLAPLELSLAEVSELGELATPESSRRPFSLIFLGPAKPVLPQAIYPLQHDALGRLEIFIVPLGLRQGQMQYQAIFT